MSGMSIPGFMMIAAFVGSFFILLVRTIPAYMEDRQIKQIFQAIVADGDMREANVRDIKLSYSKRADIENIKGITVDDVVVEKDGGLRLSADYSVIVPVGWNVSLLLQFNPAAGSK